MSDITYENKRLRQWKTFIIFMLAITFTTVSLAMITEASWARSGSLSEAIIMSFLSGGVALSAHLLPALTRRRVGKFGWGVVSLIWIVALLATLYSHTIFFISTSSNAGNLRATESTQVKDIAAQSEETKKLMQNTDARSVVAISRDIANVDIQINQLTPRACTNCKRIKANIAGLQAKKDALNVEMDESKRIASLRDKAIEMDQKAAAAKDNARLDPVAEKLMGTFKGINADAMTLFYSLLLAALLEMLATLCWWLLWADYRVVEGEVAKKSVSQKNNKRHRDTDTIALESKSEIEKLDSPETEKPLSIENKQISLKASIHQIIYKDKLIDKINEDIFIDPYVKGIFPIYKEQDNRKVQPRFLEEDINVVSFVRNITPVMIEKAEERANKAIDLSDFDSVNVPKTSSLDDLFNNDNSQSFYNEHSFDEVIEAVSEPLQDNIMQQYEPEMFYQPEESVMDEPVEIEPEIVEVHNRQENIESEPKDMIEQVVDNVESEQQAQEVFLDELEEEIQEETESVVEPSVSLLNDAENVEEEKKTANSDVVYTPRIRRPSFKNTLAINTDISPAKESESALSAVNKTESTDDSEEEIKDVYRIERHTPKFEDKMELDVRKVAAQFAKKPVDVPDSPIVFEMPVLVDAYEEKQQQQNTQYVNPRKKHTTDINVDNVDKLFEDLFSEKS